MLNFGKEKILIKSLIGFCFLFIFVYQSQAAKNAIGIRVARNADHLSPSEWYDKYAPNWYGNAGGGPASMSMDGYDAVTVGSCSSGLGETVYVNATNVVQGPLVGTADDTLYTNIYIISCPVGADQDTVDIFEQLIDNWDFNINITDPEERLKLQRDTKRLSDLNAMKREIEDYHNNISDKNKYPAIASGSYRAGQTVSYWNSWQDTLGKELQATLPTPPETGSWSALADLSQWVDASGNKTWPTDMYFPDAVGIDYTPNGCREVVVLKGQNIKSWCEGVGCVNDCPPTVVSTTTTTGWNSLMQNPKTLSFDNWFGSSRLLTAIQDNNYINEQYNPLSLSAPANLTVIDSNWPSELERPTAIANYLYSGCQHIIVIKDNRWAEHTQSSTSGECEYDGWTPVADLVNVPDTLNIKWPQDVQNPKDVGMAKDPSGKRHIFAFKDNKFREYVDINRPYVYKAFNNGLSYSLCTYFETNYSLLAGLNCVEMQSTNHAPVITPSLNNRSALIGSYFEYNIIANDVDGDTLTWVFTVDGVNYVPGQSATYNYCTDTGLACPCAGGCSSWTIYFSNSQPNIKKIYTTAPVAVMSKTISVKVTDSNGASDTDVFNFSTYKSGISFSSVPVTSWDVGISTDSHYQYDADAIDSNGYSLSYSWSGSPLPVGMNASDISSGTGVIYGQPTVAGIYPVTITASSTNGDSAIQSFSIKITDSVCGNSILSSYGLWPPPPLSTYYEECDPGSVDTSQCNVTGFGGYPKCSRTFCGDNQVQTVNGRGLTVPFNTTYAVNPNTYPAGFNEVCDDGVATDSLATTVLYNTPETGRCVIDTANNIGCVLATCGDGYYSSNGADGIASTADDEACDDGDDDTKATSATPNSPESGACIIGNIPNCTSDCCVKATCGDGYFSSNGADGIASTADDEACDDGDTDTRTTAMAPSTPNAGLCIIDLANGVACKQPACGDGYFSPSTDTNCDDGNTDLNDKCDNACAFTYCGDNVVQTPNGIGTGGVSNNGVEQCDNDDTKDCDRAGTNYNTQGRCTYTFCGDGVTQNPDHYGLTETCDDGNYNNGDGCDNLACDPEYGWYCNTSSPSSCWTTCGDAKMAGAESCDPGPTNTLDCNVTGFGGYTPCSKTFCGDGVTQSTNGQGASEFCDNGASNSNTGTCSASCAITSCGDGIVQSPNGSGFAETCDVSSPGCNSCSIVSGWECPGNVCAPKCGDGVRVGSELDPGRCDDGNINSGDGCSSTCNIESASGWTCNNATPSICIKCNDGIVQNFGKVGGEECDGGAYDASKDTCVEWSYAGGGTLGCNADCTINTTACIVGCAFDSTPTSYFDSCTFQ